MMNVENEVLDSGPDPSADLLTIEVDVQALDDLTRWAFEYAPYGRVLCRGNLHPGRTLIVQFGDEGLRVGASDILSRRMVLHGETSPAPFLLFDDLDDPSGDRSGTPGSGRQIDALFAVVTQALRLIGAENVFFFGVGRGDWLALQVGRRFADSMVLLLSPTPTVFPSRAGELPAPQSTPRTSFEFYVQEMPEQHGVGRHYLDFKHSVGVRGATGESDDGRVRFELADPGAWDNVANLGNEVQFWLEAASRHWRERLGSGSEPRRVVSVAEQSSTEVESLRASVATAQKLLETILAEHRSASRDIRVLTKEFRAEARVAHLSSARGVTETVSLLRLASILFPPEAELPPTGSFAVRPGTLATLVTTILRSKPEVIVECGSGSSTVWFAAALKYLGQGHVYALEHEPKYGAQTQHYLDENDVSSFATIVPAPLQEIETGGQNWYARSAVRGLPRKVDILFVDGPPKAVGEHARAPALAEFASRLIPGSLVLLDDMQRLDEQEIVSRWLADPSLPELEFVVGLAELHIYRVVSAPGSDATSGI